MKFFSLYIIFISLIFSFSSSSAETGIYKWYDSEGKVHYSARPEGKNAQKMHVGSKSFKKVETSKAAEDEKKAAEREKMCNEARITLKKYKKSPFLYRYDEEKKQKIRLTDAEEKEAHLQAEKDVTYWCSDIPAEVEEPEDQNQQPQTTAE